MKIRYVPYIDYSLVEFFSGVDHLSTFLKDNEENRRVGTFAVYVDDMDVPILAFPINLSYVLDLGEGTVWAGFTSSTGRKWQKHDVISWYFCEDHRQCAFNLESKFDYHREDKIFSRRLRRLAREDKVREERRRVSETAREAEDAEDTRSAKGQLFNKTSMPSEIVETLSKSVDPDLNIESKLKANQDHSGLPDDSQEHTSRSEPESRETVAEADSGVFQEKEGDDVVSAAYKDEDGIEVVEV